MSPLLLVQSSDALEKVSRSFREYSSSQGPFSLVVGVLIVFLVIGVIVYALLSNRDRLMGRRMFLKLARASGLTKDELQLLKDVARRVQPDNPPAIFVRRSLFENAVSEPPFDAERVQSVRRKVYGP